MASAVRTEHPAALPVSALLGQVWRASPAATAARWSRGLWQRQPHLNLISDAVSRLAEGPVRLLVSLPPQHGKSELVSHWAPVWFLCNWPRKRVGLVSYSAEFAETWGRKARDSVVEHQAELGVRVRQDLNRASEWELTVGGGMMTAGVGGPLTGHGFDLLIIDDPIKNRQEANSPTVRRHLWEWWRSTARTRLRPGGSIIVVMTRWHEEDLVGRLLSDSGNDRAGFFDLDEWRHIRLPALAEDNDPLGRDPEEPLWPERYDARALASLRVEVGPLDWAGLFQQRPSQQGGGIFRMDWWRYAADLPEPTGETVQFWDTAFKRGQENDYSACATMYPSDSSYVLSNMWRGRQEFPELVRTVTAMAERYNPARVYIEDAASGQSLIQALKNDTRLPVIPVRVDSDKGSRANAVTGQVEAGNVLLPSGAQWLDDFLHELTDFPGAAHDDQVDAFVGALTQLAIKPKWWWE